MSTTVLPKAWTQTDYCNKALCKGKKHVACNNKGNFATICAKNAKIIPISTQLRDQLLHKHNEYRNKIAGGFNKFPPAERMATMVWSPELAKIAVFNVKQCQMKHDACRNTNKFKKAGQNIALSSWKGTSKTIPSVINQQVLLWFNEYKDCPVSFINKYPQSTNGKKIGHFTSMMQEKSTHVGCAILRQVNREGFTEHLMTCNMAYTNVVKEPVYTSGKAASKCNTGVNPNYKFLCSTKEVYIL